MTTDDAEFVEKPEGIPTLEEVMKGWPDGEKMTQEILDINPYLDKEPWTPEPWGSVLPIERNILSDSQQIITEFVIRETQKKNRAYLAKHPQVEALVTVLLEAILMRQPYDVFGFVRSFIQKKSLKKRVDQYIVKPCRRCGRLRSSCKCKRSHRDRVIKRWKREEVEFSDHEPKFWRERFPRSVSEGSSVESVSSAEEEESIVPEELTEEEEEKEETVPKIDILGMFDSFTEVIPVDARWPFDPVQGAEDGECEHETNGHGLPPPELN